MNISGCAHTIPGDRISTLDDTSPLYRSISLIMWVLVRIAASRRRIRQETGKPSRSSRLRVRLYRLYTKTSREGRSYTGWYENHSMGLESARSKRRLLPIRAGHSRF